MATMKRTKGRGVKYWPEFFSEDGTEERFERGAKRIDIHQGKPDMLEDSHHVPDLVVRKIYWFGEDGRICPPGPPHRVRRLCWQP